MKALSNEEICDGLNRAAHLGFKDWTFEIAARTQQLVFFSGTQLRSKSGPFSALYPETARLIVAGEKMRTVLTHCENDLSGAINRLPRRFSDRDDYQRCLTLLAEIRGAIGQASEAK